MNNRALILSVSLIVIVGASFGAYYLINHGNSVPSAYNDQTPSSAPSETEVPQKTQTPYEFNTLLENASKNKFPGILNETVISLDKLPADVLYLVPPATKDAQASKVSFNDQTVGFNVTFKYGGVLLNTYKYFKSVSADKYDFVEGHYGDLAGILFIKKSGFIYKIDIIADNPQTMNVVITSVKGK